MPTGIRVLGACREGDGSRFDIRGGLNRLRARSTTKSTLQG